MFFIIIFFIFRAILITQFLLKISIFFLLYKRYVLCLLDYFLEYGYIIILLNIFIFYILTLLLKLVSEYYKKENKDLADLFLGAACLLEYLNKTNYVIYIYLIFY